MWSHSHTSMSRTIHERLDEISACLTVICCGFCNVCLRPIMCICSYRRVPPLGAFGESCVLSEEHLEKFPGQATLETSFHWIRVSMCLILPVNLRLVDWVCLLNMPNLCCGSVALRLHVIRAASSSCSPCCTVHIHCVASLLCAYAANAV